jgi:hypothetical protein
VKVLKLTGTKARKLQATHAYSALYYESKLKGIISDRWDAHEENDSGKKDTKPPLWFRNKVTKELLEVETDDVKEEVQRYREEGSLDEDDDDDEDVDERDKEEIRRRAKARQYQR